PRRFDRTPAPQNPLPNPTPTNNLVRRRDSADPIHGPGGREAFQFRSGAQLAESEGGYDGRVDAGLGLAVEFFVWCIINPLLHLAQQLVPDFALTLHFIHLVVTSLYSHSVPTNLLWWVLQIASAGVMISLGVWSCQWRELRPINFGGSNTAPAAQGENAAGESSGGGDEEEGYGRGRGRGRGRDGAGDYEMVSIKPEAEAS
ncbi:Protein SYS1, partial [Lachnellula suecica]